ncbi:Gfo/Idh/MocA family protein [Sungkyunkwania multivorans]|uniref:Gfo/Idh/MocA family protein n=1 Tax=Sungkyunkwania multivorans TaxID=1173618 RepID=A0ABW3D135_9FLAO
MKRRSFIKKTAIASSAFTIVPSFVLGGRHIAPSDTLYMAAIGVGGRGGGVVRELFETGKVKFVALCDVDDSRAKQSFEKYPKAKKYTDYRKVYDNHVKEIDAFTVATPDHTHAIISLPFMRAKKHAYVEKPLTHNIYEARLMTKVAEEHGITTQMGNQGASGDGIRQAKEWIEAGAIGKVYRVDSWTNRPVWPQGLKNITDKEKIPKTLDWDLWLGPAAMRPYNSAYLPFKWRGFWDFGTGALGDMGCHIMETPFNVLELGYPTEAEASCTTVWAGDFIEANYDKVCPPSSIVRLKFDSKKHGQVALNWYDGGIMPDLPDELKDDELLGDWNGGSLFYGDRGMMVTGTYSRNPRLLPSELNTLFQPPKPSIKRVQGGDNKHANEFVQACLNNGTTSSPFSYAGPLTEAVLMGNLAIKAFQYKVLKEGKTPTSWAPYDYPGRRKLLWDGKNMKVTNYEKANEWVTRDYRDGWEVK